MRTTGTGREESARPVLQRLGQARAVLGQLLGGRGRGSEALQVLSHARNLAAAHVAHLHRDESIQAGQVSTTIRLQRQ